MCTNKFSCRVPLVAVILMLGLVALSGCNTAMQQSNAVVADPVIGTWNAVFYENIGDPTQVSFAQGTVWADTFETDGTMTNLYNSNKITGTWAKSSSGYLITWPANGGGTVTFSATISNGYLSYTTDNVHMSFFAK